MRTTNAATPFIAAALIALSMQPLSAGIVATYEFNDNFNANEIGVPALVPVDPLGTSLFVNNGGNKAWRFNGTNLNAEQSGLKLDTFGLLNPNAMTPYSIEIVFRFFENNNLWRRIVDVEDRKSDNGFYVDPSNNLNVFPQTGSSASFSTGEFHNVILSVDPTANSGAGAIYAFLDFFDVQINNLHSHIMDLVNPNNDGTTPVNIFLDNVLAGGQQEWSSGEITMLRLYDNAITPNEAADLGSVPEPMSILIWSLLSGTVAFSRSRNLRRRYA